MHGFIIETTKKHRSFVKKIVINLSIVLVLLSGFGLYTYGTETLDTSLVSAKKLLPFSVDIATPVQGGDIIIAPPKITPPKLPLLQGELPLQENIAAKGIIVKDVETGMILYHKNEYTPHPIASITKLMSALVLLEHDIDWDSTAVVPPDTIIDTHMYAGDTYSLQELWTSMLVGSSNKAVISLIDATHWTREMFIARMNERANELGMGNTIFTDPTGLDEENKSTPADIVMLVEEALRYEKIREGLLTKEITLFSEERQKKHHIWSTNWLLLGWIPHEFAVLYGGKTGYIGASGYNFTMQVADTKDHKVNVVVFGALSHEARFTIARDIATDVFAQYIWPDEQQ